MAKQTETFPEDELFKQHTAAHFQRLLGLLASSQPVRTGQNNGATQTALTRLPQRPSYHASVLGSDLKTGKEVVVTHRDRPQGLYCIGVNGTGKTTLLANLIKRDLELGCGLCLIEPHGDLTRTVLSLVPPERLPDVILLDVMESAAFPFGLNLFQSALPGDPHEDAKTASFLMHLFEKVWNVGTETPRLQQVLRNVTRTLLSNPGMTFAEIPLLLWDDTAREKLVSNVTNTQTRLFWQQYNRRSPRERSELTDSTMNKVDAYLNEPMIAHIVSQATSTINFRQIMDAGKILLIQLSPQLEEMSRLLGAVMIGRLLMAAFSRTDQPEAERRQFNLYVDEFQRFATSDWRTFLEEARKFKVAITMAHQSISQLEESLQTAAMGAGTIVVFRVSGEDARVLARSFDATPTQEQIGVEPIRAPVTDVVSHLVRRGHTHARISTFVSEYLMPLETTLQKVRGYTGPFAWGCTLIRTNYVIETRRLVNDVLFHCMQTGRADGFIPPLALFVLGGAADDGITQVFYDDIKRNVLFSGPECLGFYESANRFGEAAFLADQKAVDDLLKKHAKKKVWDDVFLSRMVYPGPAFIRMLRSLRETMAILAKEPILVDTGQYQPVYRQRTYTDMQAQIANDLSQQANYLARVKLLTDEHTIGTRLHPPLLSEALVNERIRQIKQRMQALGYCKPAQEVEEEVHLRHERLRERDTPPPPTHTQGTNRRRYRPRPTARDT